MTTLREELEKLADEPWPHGGPRYGRTELAIAAANLALEAAAKRCDTMGHALVERWQDADDEMRTYVQARAWDYGLCAFAIRAMRVG